MTKRKKKGRGSYVTQSVTVSRCCRRIVRHGRVLAVIEDASELEVDAMLSTLNALRMKE